MVGRSPLTCSSYPYSMLFATRYHAVVSSVLEYISPRLKHNCRLAPNYSLTTVREINQLIHIKSHMDVRIGEVFQGSFCECRSFFLVRNIFPKSFDSHRYSVERTSDDKRSGPSGQALVYHKPKRNVGNLYANHRYQTTPL
jgi:hypothetical protein